MLGNSETIALRNDQAIQSEEKRKKERKKGTGFEVNIKEVSKEFPKTILSRDLDSLEAG